MLIKINGEEIAAYPFEFSVTPMDLDNGETTVRTMDGTLNRDRITVKRQINWSFNALSWEAISALLKSMSATFFDVYYPDPMEGDYVTKTFYVGNRPTTVAIARGDEIVWSGLKVTLTER